MKHHKAFNFIGLFKDIIIFEKMSLGVSRSISFKNFAQEHFPKYILVLYSYENTAFINVVS